MKRIFIDPSKCDGCKNCYIACIEAHRENRDGGFYSVDMTDRANEARNRIELDGNGRFIPIFCRHCDEPECAGSCMSGALQKDSFTQHVTYDEEKCGSCFMCVMNCPFGVIKPDRATGSKVIKCDFCAKDNEEPNCVKACPKKAIYVEEAV
jgi:carbon-monoxide dehydrogenase iron sulfur subunit